MLVNTLLMTSTNATRYDRGYTPKEVYVFGAGLSKDFGLPLARELLFEMRKCICDLGEESQLKQVYQFLQFFYPGFSPSGQSYPDIEDVLGMLDVAEAYAELRGKYPGYRWRQEKVRQIQGKLNRMLGKYLWTFQEKYADKNYAGIESLRKFVRRRTTRVTYITFNYDLLLETALSLECIPYSYSLAPKSNIVTVLKPHGSINWFLKNNGRPPSSHSTKWESFGIEIAITRCLDPREIMFKGNGWKKAAIITPTPNKQIEMPVMEKIWTTFSSSIHTTPKLFIIGYSMPDADRLARLVLNRAGPIHSASRQITVVNPSNIEAVYEKNVSPNCIFVPEKFKKWNQTFK